MHEAVERTVAGHVRSEQWYPTVILPTRAQQQPAASCEPILTVDCQAGSAAIFLLAFVAAVEVRGDHFSCRAIAGLGVDLRTH